MKSVWVAIALALLAGCSDGQREGARGETPDPDSATAMAATPVRVAEVVVGTIELSVSGAGRTEALRALRIRAPFTGRLLSLEVADGDAVAKGDVIGVIVAQNSDAALEGARALLATAKSEQERQDGRRAVELAEATLVRHPLRALAGGVVLSHTSSAGDFVSEGDEIATIADSSSVAFVAQIAQSDLRDVGPGQRVAVEIAAEPEPLAGVVHGVLPTASAENLNAPVRIDFAPSQHRLAIGLFGTARITVGEHRDVLIIPASAVMRDDVTGISRAAVLSADGTIHWVELIALARQPDRVEVRSTGLAAGARVVISGQVGLPESARVRIES
jgi:multidrug efflux pump subunit AcrA (membrane-fusion protein)